MGWHRKSHLQHSVGDATSELQQQLDNSPTLGAKQIVFFVPLVEVGLLTGLRASNPIDCRWEWERRGVSG